MAPPQAGVHRRRPRRRADRSADPGDCPHRHGVRLNGRRRSRRWHPAVPPPWACPPTTVWPMIGIRRAEAPPRDPRDPAANISRPSNSANHIEQCLPGHTGRHGIQDRTPHVPAGRAATAPGSSLLRSGLCPVGHINRLDNLAVSGQSADVGLRAAPGHLHRPPERGIRVAPAPPGPRHAPRPPCPVAQDHYVRSRTRLRRASGPACLDHARVPGEQPDWACQVIAMCGESCPHDSAPGRGGRGRFSVYPRWVIWRMRRILRGAWLTRSTAAVSGSTRVRVIPSSMP
ncbi:hypothetical protein DWB77_00459 [Streptomyces hundungensis]|uniref:Uncharacterized protein n=1 Tax=Streptomyces hundungensis TaxID=1077946 RepID=A0A387HC92_9ACTN|nr:hypothetical protein DWB77_00459 [Streptomyces hundungensis]